MDDLYIELNTRNKAVSEKWDNISPELMNQALIALRRILGKPDSINDRKIKGVTKGPRCSSCHRRRTMEGMDIYDYNPMQAITGRPLGWYSGEDGEVCPACMTIIMARQYV